MKRFWLSAVLIIGAVFTACQATIKSPPPLKVLIIAGGWAHDYETWYHKKDMETLNAAGITNIIYTEDSAEAAKALPNVDVMVCGGNKVHFDTPEFKEAISNYVAAGKGIVLLHSGVWYNWWGYWNTCLAGGGARDHDGVAEFTETVLKDHPVTRGLPHTFPMVDEWYHIQHEPHGSPIEVLVEGSKPGRPIYPSVWITHFGNARIVCDALGHDGSSHNSPYFQQLLVNAVKWAGGETK